MTPAAPVERDLVFTAEMVSAWDDDLKAVVRVGRRRLRVTPEASERLMRHLRQLPWNRDAIL